MPEREITMSAEERRRAKFGSTDELVPLEVNKSRFTDVMEVGKRGSAGSAKKKEARRPKRVSAVDQLNIFLSMPPGDNRNALVQGLLNRRGDDLSLAETKRAADSFIDEPVTVKPAAPKAEKEAIHNPNKEKLKNESTLRQFMREGAIEAVRLAAGKDDLTLKSVREKIIQSLGFDPKTFVPVNLFGDLPNERREVVQEQVEAEIEARCNLRLAAWKEQDFQDMKFGEATTKYKESLERGEFNVAQISNDTLAWLSKTIPSTVGEAVRRGDRSEKPLTTDRVDEAFKLLHLGGEVVEYFRRLWNGDQIDQNALSRLNITQNVKDGILKLTKDDVFQTQPSATDDEGVTVLTDRGNSLIDSLLPYGVPKKYKDLFIDRITGKDKKSFYDGSLPDHREALKKLLVADYGKDVENLAWQLFQGLRCEGMYFSGHYLGLLTLLDQSRNFLALNFDSWVGSRHNKIVVNRGGRLVDSEGVEVKVTDYDKVSLSKRKVVNIGGKLYLRQTDDAKSFTKKTLILGGVDVRLPEGFVIPLKNAFKDEIIKVATAPLGQRVAVSEVLDEHYKKWALNGEFLKMSSSGGRGDKTIEAQNSSAIVYGYDFRESLKKIRDLGASQDKSSQIGPAVEALNAIKKGCRDLISKGVMSVAESRQVLDREIKNVFWELGVNNVFNTAGTQDVNKPNFLRPSGYNDLFEKFAVIPSTGTPLLDTDEELERLRVLVVVWRKQSMERLKQMAGINASDEDRKMLKKEEEMMTRVLPKRLGMGVLTQGQDIANRFDHVYARILGQK